MRNSIDIKYNGNTVIEFNLHTIHITHSHTKIQNRYIYFATNGRYVVNNIKSHNIIYLLLLIIHINCKLVLRQFTVFSFCKAIDLYFDDNLTEDVNTKNL